MGPRSDPALRAAIENDGAAEVVGASDDSAASWPWSAVFRLPEGWTAASSELGGVIKATKAVAMFQSLAAKNGAVLRDRTEVIDIAKQEKMSHRSTLLQMLLDEESLSDGDEEFISSAVDIVYDEFDDDEVPKRGGSVIHYFNGLKLISTLVKLMPEWLCNNRVISALVDNMN
uniref:Uncharacterized protein n=1 Tax=Oryza glumipatula TaxID=40148 RepID=A0A0E0BTR8_9ORYZ